jgi:hypothetical protein
VRLARIADGDQQHDRSGRDLHGTDDSEEEHGKA